MGLYSNRCCIIPWFKNFPMVYFKTTAKFSKSMEFFKTLGDMDQVNGPKELLVCIVFSTEISHDFLTPEVRKEFRGWNFSLTQLKISCAVKVVYSQSNWFIYGLFLARMKIYKNPMIQRLF